MTEGKILYVLVVLYLSMVIGSFIKYQMKGVKGGTLILSVVTPFILLIIPVFFSLKEFYRNKSTLAKRIKSSLCLFKDTVRVFPAIVGLIGNTLIQAKLASRKPAHKRTSKKNKRNSLQFKPIPKRKLFYNHLVLFENFINTHSPHPRTKFVS